MLLQLLTSIDILLNLKKKFISKCKCVHLFHDLTLYLNNSLAELFPGEGGLGACIGEGIMEMLKESESGGLGGE